MESIDVRTVVDKAIAREEEAFSFYTRLHERAADPEAKQTLQFLAKEEQAHREFLVAYRDGKRAFRALKMSDVVDYGLAQHLDPPQMDEDMDSASIYLVAAHRELASHTFYRELAALQPHGELRDMLERMSAEELRHKEKVEYLYANTAFPQTAGG